jgi:hypothetical protein
MDLRGWPRPNEGVPGTPPAPVPRDLPGTWPTPPPKEWEAPSVLGNVEALTNPLLLLTGPGRSPAIEDGTDALRTRLTALGRPPDRLELDPDPAKARPLVYRKIEQFLHPRPAATAAAAATSGESR